MATITDTELNNLITALQTLNDDFAAINADVFETLGGSAEEDVEVSSVSMQTSETQELNVAAEIDEISDSLVWLTDAVNALFSISNISLGTLSSPDVTTIKSPPSSSEK
jgi:hypothetical protein